MKIVDEVKFEKKLEKEFGPLRKNEVMEILGKCCPDPQGDVLSPVIVMEGIGRLEDAASVASLRPDRIAAEDFHQLAGLLYFILGLRDGNRARAWYSLFRMLDPRDTEVPGSQG